MVEVFDNEAIQFFISSEVENSTILEVKLGTENVDYLEALPMDAYNVSMDDAVSQISQLILMYPCYKWHPLLGYIGRHLGLSNSYATTTITLTVQVASIDFDLR